MKKIVLVLISLLSLTGCYDLTDEEAEKMAIERFEQHINSTYCQGGILYHISTVNYEWNNPSIKKDMVNPNFCTIDTPPVRTILKAPTTPNN